MTTLLTTFISSPSSKHFEQPRNIFPTSDVSHLAFDSLNPEYSNSISVNHCLSVLPAPKSSMASSPILRNNENFAPTTQGRYDYFTSSPYPAKRLLRPSPQRNTPDRVGHQIHTLRSPDKSRPVKDTLYPVVHRTFLKALDNKYNTASKAIENSDTGIHAYHTGSSKYHDEHFESDCFGAGPRSPKLTYHEEEHLQSFPMWLSPTNHKLKCSDTSSAFVHTVRTASMSDGSFSIFARSSRVGHSSDSQMMLNSYLRCSLDSDRPVTALSIDEASIKRGIRRRQIIEELITTEEGYFADLKALVYLYTTLLASATNISTRLCASIQRNIDGLLHIHEKLLDRLHKAEFHAAARKWADTRFPVRLQTSRHKRWNKEAKIDRKQHRRRSSTDSFDRGRKQTRPGIAEPEDVNEIVKIFGETLTDLFAYEEYCANHEIIAHELQKRMPHLWSAYEAGVESLARSITAINKKEASGRRSLTVGDLLIKPIQRICRYPLLLEDLSAQTPVADSPGAHAELESLLFRFREVIQAVNEATDNPLARVQIQRKWMLQDRLHFSKIDISSPEFRSLGKIQLCGVLFVTYQTTTRVDGHYSLCTLFDDHLLLATPTADNSKFDVLALISLTDLKIESAADGKGKHTHLTGVAYTYASNSTGLQCSSALHTWKVSFVVRDNLHELIMSACSKTEEEQWKLGIEGGFHSSRNLEDGFQLASCLNCDLKSIGVLFGSHKSLARELSIQRAATVGNRGNLIQVIVRNTHNAQDLHEFRTPSGPPIHRSQSHLNPKRIHILDPRRSERVRIENSLAEIWTKDRIPFPGMIGSRGGQIIRASAGSLARKLSFASLHSPFGRRTSSLTTVRKKSYETFFEHRPRFEVRKDSIDNFTPARSRPAEIPEVDDMRSVVGRMIGTEIVNRKRASFSGGDVVLNRSKSKKSQRISVVKVGPEDSAGIFYQASDEKAGIGLTNDEGFEVKDEVIVLEDSLVGGRRRKRWSNPISMLKGLGTEARNVLHSSNL